MALGPGKYDHLATEVRKQSRAKGVIVIIFGGSLGSGFSCQADLATTMQLPTILRNVADEIEQSGD